MMNGVHCQVSTMTSENSARRWFVSHSKRPSPRLSENEFTTPNCTSSMNFQNRPTTTGDSIIGIRNIVVSAPRPLMRREIRNAIAKPISVCSATAPTTKIAVVTARLCVTGDVRTSM